MIRRSFAFLDNAIHDLDGGVMEDFDSILYQTENFVVVPSLGSLVEGWLLVVAKSRALSMASLPMVQRNELESLKTHVARMLVETYGPVVAFEHGPAVCGTDVGCTVDQAHLHLVPFAHDLLEQIGEVRSERLSWAPSHGFTEAIKLINTGRSYLYFETIGDTPLVACASGSPSQFFRRAIAGRLGIPDKFNWREYPMRENVRRTLDKLAGRFDLITQESLFSCT